MCQMWIIPLAGRETNLHRDIGAGDLNAFYLAAQSAARYCPQSRTYYQRKRAEGKNHKQAVLSLARRRLNVLWAVIRDNTPYQQPVEAGTSIAHGYKRS